MQKKNNGYRSGFVAILGRPNVGKSTLMNALVGEKVAITSSRAQTTRNRIMGVMTRENLQIVFLDTPGLHAPRNKLGEYMMGTVQDALDGIDAVILMLDATDVRNADMEILEKYGSLPVKRALVVNKIDQVNSDTLAPLLERLSSQPMDAFVPISALKKNGLDRLVSQLAFWMPQGPQYFPDDMVTDQPERVIVAEMIREKALRNLRDEIPHGIGVEVLAMENEGDEKRAVTIHANIFFVFKFVSINEFKWIYLVCSIIEPFLTIGFTIDTWHKVLRSLYILNESLRDSVSRNRITRNGKTYLVKANLSSFVKPTCKAFVVRVRKSVITCENRACVFRSKLESYPYHISARHAYGDFYIAAIGRRNNSFFLSTNFN